MNLPRVGSPPPRLFVGRGPELEALRAALSEALAGATRIVVVSGEAGIGKTTLVERLRLEAAGVGVTGARTTGVRQRGAPAFWPWVQILRQLQPGAQSKHRGDTADPIPPHLGELLRLPRDEPPARDDELDSAFPSEARFYLFDAIASFIDGAARDAGLVLILDDAERFDPDSVSLLGYLADTLVEARLLLLVTSEAILGDESSNLLSGLARARDVGWIRLRPLEHAETESLLTGLVGRPLPAGAAARIDQLAAGNPLFLTELALELRARPIDEAAIATAGPAATMPERVRALVTYRVASLSRECRDILDIAAVVEPDFSPELVAEVAGVPSSRALEILGEARRAGLLNEVVERPGRFAFRHGLVRGALEAGLHPAARMHLHRQVGEALEKALVAQPSGAPGAWSALAWHWHEAGDQTRATRYAALAGDAATGQLAFEEAARLYRLALMDSPIGSVPTLERAALTFRLANAEYRAGNVAGAAEAILAGVEIARRLDRLDLLVQAPFVIQDLGNPVVSANLLAECEALLTSDGVPAEVRVRLLAQQAVILSETGRLAEAIVASDRAMGLAAGTDDPIVLAWLLPSRQLVLAGPDWPHERMRLAERALHVARAGASSAMAFEARVWRLDALWELGNIAAVESELAMLDGLASQLHHPQVRWSVGRARAALALLRGRFAEAERLSEAATATLPADNFMARLLDVGFTGLIAAECGDPDWLDTADLLDQVPGVLGRCTKARVLLAVGRERAARECYEQVRDQAAEVPRDARWMPSMALLADLAVELEDRSTAQICYESLTPFEDRLVASGGGSIACLGATSFFLGRLASVLGELGEAERLLRHALSRNAAAGARPWVARGQLAMAELLWQRGAGVRGATELASQAQQSATDLGMRPLARRAALLADAWRADAGSPGRLSRREREVAALVSEGLTNRQIGGVLFIAPRTAENHVQHILVKLGLSSRAEIAAWAVREQLRGPNQK